MEANKAGDDHTSQLVDLDPHLKTQTVPVDQVELGTQLVVQRRSAADHRSVSIKLVTRLTPHSTQVAPVNQPGRPQLLQFQILDWIPEQIVPTMIVKLVQSELAVPQQ